MSFALQTRASKLAAVTVALSIVAMGAVAFAESSTSFTDDYYGKYLVSQFSRLGPATAFLYDNKSVETSSFDFPAYMSNTCFRPTDYDMPYCRDTFGPYANLKQTLESGKLTMLLKQYKMFTGEERVIAILTGRTVAGGQLTPVAAAPVVTDQTSYRELSDRSTVIWRICNRKYTSVREANACFQRNHNLIYRGEDVSIALNMH